jgi:hypothetical protein
MKRGLMDDMMIGRVRSSITALLQLNFGSKVASHGYPRCYGRLAVVSDMDDGGFALNVDKELRGSAVL